MVSGQRGRLRGEWAGARAPPLLGSRPLKSRERATTDAWGPVFLIHLPTFPSLTPPHTIPFASSTLQISEVAIHPRYTDSEQGFDMAVLTIGNPPTTALYNTGNVRKAGVNKEAAALAATTPLTIAGWGNVSGRGGRTLSTTLRQVASRTTDWAACRADADRNAGSLPANAEDLLVCASSAGATSTCAGDSGSPLFLRSRGAGSDRPTVKVVGVMSFGYGSPLDACPPGSPSFYTRVDTNVDWIFSHLDGGWRGWERAP